MVRPSVCAPASQETGSPDERHTSTMLTSWAAAKVGAPHTRATQASGTVKVLITSSLANENGAVVIVSQLCPTRIDSTLADMVQYRATRALRLQCTKPAKQGVR